jgi:hypothetical protein
MVSYTTSNAFIWGLVSSSILLLHDAPHIVMVSGQTCDEYKFNVSACMLYKGSDTMAACQSCLVSGLNELQGLVPNPQESSTTTASSDFGSSLASANASAAQCDKASGVLCKILQSDCQESCLITSCYNTTTLWAQCLADTYELPNCNVTCPDVLKNISASNTNSSSNGAGGDATSNGAASGKLFGASAAAVGALIAVAWSGLVAMAL